MSDKEEIHQADTGRAETSSGERSHGEDLVREIGGSSTTTESPTIPVARLLRGLANLIEDRQATPTRLDTPAANRSKRPVRCTASLVGSDKCRADRATQAMVRREFERLGFDVLRTLDTSVRIEGPPQLYEKCFQTHLDPVWTKHGIRFDLSAPATLPPGLMPFVHAIWIGGEARTLTWPDPPDDYVDVVLHYPPPPGYGGMGQSAGQWPTMPPRHKMPETEVTWKYMQEPNPLYRLPKYLWKEYYGKTEFDHFYPGMISPSGTSNLFKVGERWPSLLFLSDVRDLHQITKLSELIPGEHFYGVGTTIYIIDTGVKTKTPPMAPPFGPTFFEQAPHPGFGGYDVQLRSTQGVPLEEVDMSGHGTMCTAAALAMAPHARIVNVLAWEPTAENFVAALEWAIDDAVNANGAADGGPAVVSVSMSIAEGQSPDWYDAFKPAIDKANDNGVIVCCAAGNLGVLTSNGVPLGLDSGDVPTYVPEDTPPGNMKGVISVGGAFPTHLANPQDPAAWEAASYAMSGVADTPEGARQYPDLCGVVGRAPLGVLVLVPTLPGNNSGGNQDLSGKAWDQTLWMDGRIVGAGTSFATPCSAGIVALLLEKFPWFPSDKYWGDNSIDKIRSFLQVSCIPVESGQSASGQTPAEGATGAGFLNAYKLIENALLKK